MTVYASEAVASAYVFWARGESRADETAPRATRASAPPGMSGTLASRALLLPRLRATRALERFRNEVALSAWVQLQYTSVRDIYEDRQPLWGVAPGGGLLNLGRPYVWSTSCDGRRVRPGRKAGNAAAGERSDGGGFVVGGCLGC